MLGVDVVIDLVYLCQNQVVRVKLVQDLVEGLVEGLVLARVVNDCRDVVLIVDCLLLCDIKIKSLFT